MSPSTTDRPVAATSARRTAAPRFLANLLRQPLAVACLVFLLALVVIAIIAPLALPDVATERAGDLLAIRQGPSLEHLLGTDSLGRDVLGRLLVGTGVTLLGAAEALLVVVLIGVPLGLIAGYTRGWPDRALMWVSDLSMALPGVVLILVVLAVFPGSMLAAMVTLGVISAPGLLRVTRSATLPVREELYVAAARVSGLSHGYIITRHVLPRIGGPIIVQASLIAASAIIVQTGLSFIGLIAPEPQPSWGGMLADGVRALTSTPALIIPPGLAIAATALALGLLGDAVRDASAEVWSSSAGVRVRVPRRRPVPAHSVEDATGTDVLELAGVSVEFVTRAGTRPVIRNASFALGGGEVVGLVGESGSGKSVTAKAIMGLLPTGGRVAEGSIRFAGQDLTALGERELRAIRGRRIALISQEPMISLDPAFRVGTQLAEVVRVHRGVGRREARRIVIELLAEVRLPNPNEVARRYPHELSGGMAQRVAIARALAGEPEVLIADEPTTALDVTVQAEILDLLRRLQQERGMSVLFVTHDWGVVADICDRAVVMYAGEVVEEGPVAELFAAPRHPYTAGLLASNPHAVPAGGRLPAIAGSVPSPGEWPAGCHFAPRCPLAVAACTGGPIPLVRLRDGHETRCIRHDLVGAPDAVAHHGRPA